MVKKSFQVIQIFIFCIFLFKFNYCQEIVEEDDIELSPSLRILQVKSTTKFKEVQVPTNIQKDCHISCTLCASKSQSHCYKCPKDSQFIPLQNVTLIYKPYRTGEGTGYGQVSKQIGFCSCLLQSNKQKPSFHQNLVLDLNDYFETTYYNDIKKGCIKPPGNKVFLEKIIRYFRTLGILFAIGELIIYQRLFPVLILFSTLQELAQGGYIFFHKLQGQINILNFFNISDEVLSKYASLSPGEHSYKQTLVSKNYADIWMFLNNEDKGFDNIATLVLSAQVVLIVIVYILQIRKRFGLMAKIRTILLYVFTTLSFLTVSQFSTYFFIQFSLPGKSNFSGIVILFILIQWLITPAVILSYTNGKKSFVLFDRLKLYRANFFTRNLIFMIYLQKMINPLVLYTLYNSPYTAATILLSYFGSMVVLGLLIRPFDPSSCYYNLRFVVSQLICAMLYWSIREQVDKESESSKINKVLDFQYILLASFMAAIALFTIITNISQCLTGKKEKTKYELKYYEYSIQDKIRLLNRNKIAHHSSDENEKDNRVGVINNDDIDHKHHNNGWVDEEGNMGQSKIVDQDEDGLAELEGVEGSETQQSNDQNNNQQQYDEEQARNIRMMEDASVIQVQSNSRLDELSEAERFRLYQESLKKDKKQVNKDNLDIFANLRNALRKFIYVHNKKSNKLDKEQEKKENVAKKKKDWKM